MRQEEWVCVTHQDGVCAEWPRFYEVGLRTLGSPFAALRKVLASRTALFGVALGACLLWVYLPTIDEMVRRWSSENNYSHGFLVPAFACVLLWLRRAQAKRIQSGFYGVGLIFFAVAALLRFAATYVYFDWLDAFSFLICLAGVIAFLGGRAAVAWSWPAVAFLVFMVPLPYSAERALALPLQRLATKTSTYALQTLGLPALSEGNIIALNEARLGIVEACTGLGMSMTFLALATGLALMVRRPLLDRLIIVGSAAPIAVLSNIVRITATGILHETAGRELADIVFHNLAGWLMMPLALLFLWIELKILDRLLIVSQATRGVAPVVGAAGIRAKKTSAGLAAVMNVPR